VADGGAAYRQWQEIKKAEKPNQPDASLLGEQPKGLPALVAAYRLQEKAAAVGFDWPAAEGAFEKVREETGEVERAMRDGETSPELARELGDLLFAVVNLSRKLGVDPERELRATMHRFRERFVHIERRLAESGRTPLQSDLEEMDRLWDEAKRIQRASLPAKGNA
jgi:MazG family protein